MYRLFIIRGMNPESPGSIAPNPDENPNTPAPESSAFTALTDKVGGGVVTQSLNSADLPKKFAKYQAMKGMFAAVPMFFVGIIIAAVVYNKTHSKKDLLIIILADIVVGGFTFLISYISYRQLKKAQAQPTTFNQFQSGTAVTYTTPLPPTTVAADEVVGSWLGPVWVGGKQGIDVQVLNHESDHQTANTLLFTNKQIITILLGPQDVPSSLAGGLLNQVASSSIQYSDEAEAAKNQEFTLLYAKKWEAIMQNLLVQNIQALQQNHLTSGIPFDQIDHVEVKRSLINPGLVIHMRDGKKLTYPTQRKDLLDQAQNYLQQYVTVQ
jgi:hypothetical protein